MCDSDGKMVTVAEDDAIVTAFKRVQPVQKDINDSLTKGVELSVCTVSQKRDNYLRTHKKKEMGLSQHTHTNKKTNPHRTGHQVFLSKTT